MKETSYRVEAVLFDFDGTLTRPGALDFNAIRRLIDCPMELPILEYIDGLEDPDRRAEHHAVLDDAEMKAAAESEPNDGAEELIRYIRSSGLPVGVITRNSRGSVERALENFNDLRASDFDLIISRDDPVAPKPSPEGVELAARRFDVEASRMMVVGDYIFDVQAGAAAGAVTVFLDSDKYHGPRPVKSDHAITKLAELKSLIRLGLPLPAGKFPNDLLLDFFEKLPFDDPSVLVRPGVGEDAAAVDVSGEEILILKSDPITFATEGIGQYAVLINANDIATTGAAPRWFLTTLLFPCGATASEILAVMRELADVCGQWGITLCGGHTEITDAVRRPVVAGMMTGVVEKRRLVDKKNMRPGDHVLVTKGAAVEGTAIIAREFGDKLKSLGLSTAEIETASHFLKRVSILEEARTAADFPGTSAMHDVTEGGLATALYELSAAGQGKIRGRMDAIPVFRETRRMCELLDIDPLGLIGSGSLLIACRPGESDALVTAIREKGVEATRIGEVLEDAGPGVEAFRGDQPAEWPRFEVDEITRLF